MKIVSFVAACSNSGKTTLIEKVVKILKSRGLRVAVVKHASGGFEVDRPGKDSWRFQQAGADSVVLVGAGNMAIMKKLTHDPTPEELVASGDDADVVIYEGFKQNARNKIEVFRSGISGRAPLCLSNTTYVALVSDVRHSVGVPQFDLNDAEGVVEFILKDSQ